MKITSEKELVNQLSHNSKEAFNSLYKIYWEKLYSFSFKMSGDKEFSENVVQDVFVDLWNKRKSLKITSSIEGYLVQAVKYQVFKSYRYKKFNPTVIESEFEKYLIENIPDNNSELIEKVYLAINKLSEKRKQILLMHKLQELDIEQISHELKISKQTVKNQLSSAIKQLRIDLKKVAYLFFI
ncbi:RNA polymerase sigma factor [Abyssalbus ytuae]|uniref:Sigma-70 family RNA polymerase sigma factor n=1 Tax=Abyssalbus ytuae TaxID=2926907 RepID=A0A9E7A198_9FLAO|nr:sigma-70 family RNA polymerase sigma factor [Abyssalbus ytuae]UOB17901.1 sigma-70 family RNA polymerase sigma factor [Abyssalbus ytuae]